MPSGAKSLNGTVDQCSCSLIAFNVSPYGHRQQIAEEVVFGKGIKSLDDDGTGSQLTVPGSNVPGTDLC